MPKKEQLIDANKKLEIDGLCLKYHQSGSGPPIILIHGLGLSLQEWQKNLETLARWGTVYALDLPGFGDSEDPDETLRAQHLAKIALKFASALNLGPAVWIGHSLGGAVCLWAATLQPQAVRGMVLAASLGLAPHPSLFRRFLGLCIDGFFERPSFMFKLYRAYFQAGPWRILRTIQKSQSHQILRQITRLSMPVLVVNGRWDPIVSLREGRLLSRRLLKGGWQVLDAPHGLIYTCAGPFNHLLNDFFARHFGIPLDSIELETDDSVEHERLSG